jgi:hypothetical protein
MNPYCNARLGVYAKGGSIISLNTIAFDLLSDPSRGTCSAS